MTFIYSCAGMLTLFFAWMGILFAYEAWKESKLREDILDWIKRKRRK